MNDADLSAIESLYGRLTSAHAAFRKRTGKPLTLAEKVLCSHLVDLGGALPERGRTYNDLHRDGADGAAAVRHGGPQQGGGAQHRAL